jgi:hypothetical protein
MSYSPTPTSVPISFLPFLSILSARKYGGRTQHERTRISIRPLDPTPIIGHVDFSRLRQKEGCGSGRFIPDLGSNNNKRGGEKLVLTFFVAIIP